MQKGRDEEYIRQTFALARQAQELGDYPFGALIVCNGVIIAEARNDTNNKVTGHAEVSAIELAVKKLGNDLSNCTLYSNFEPCAMCAFLIRDHNISRVVFSVHSPHWGGHSRWNILESRVDNPTFTSANKTNVPEITSDILEEEGKQMFDHLDWKMHLR